MSLSFHRICCSTCMWLSFAAFLALQIYCSHAVDSATPSRHLIARLDAANGTASLNSMLHNSTLKPQAAKLETVIMLKQSPPKEKAVEGETVLFLCLFNHSGQSNFSVMWYNQKGQEKVMVLVENETKQEDYLGRAFLRADWHLGNASMTLLNVTISDFGIYICSLKLPDGSTVEGDGTKLSVRRSLGLFGMEESIGTIIGVVAAAIGVTIGLVTIIVPQCREKLPCLRK
ncbi:immunoglobulin superfamily member [Polypterus senegalus]|uniref:immunoglobulin superfamily member n=1 Tax=Polypterus senegalus TaxID=55291 RepID=UPI0019641E21|nr:immunoglobulin superfamily member [Polypterus senegalus]